METASRDLGRTRVPTALFYGTHDQIIEDEPMALALERAGEPPNLRTAFYEDGWHLLNRDRQALRVYGDVAAFLRDPAAPFPSGAPPVPANSQRLETVMLARQEQAAYLARTKICSGKAQFRA
ncbi:lysophospholipase [Brevundimonas denitrificans]|uniref:lysophospholipase n=1 Tax=Brevundimonas denitrificans TaxID=1443434 RepID=UPI00223AE1B3|nr:lysophospholipase [Brevundimonas denitrificans]